MSTGKARFCKTCTLDITTITEDRCPACKSKINIPTNKLYATPDYLSYQKDSLLKELELDKLKPGDTKYDEKYAEISNELVNWARSGPDEDKVAALMDAAIIVKEILHSDANSFTVLTVLKVAKSIGNLANRIEEYLKAGGSAYDRELRSISAEFRDGGRGQEAVGSCGSEI